jgi:hypothetical protein
MFAAATVGVQLLGQKFVEQQVKMVDAVFALDREAALIVGA